MAFRLTATLTALCAAAALSACNGENDAANAQTERAAPTGDLRMVVEGDHVIGAEDAPVVIIEYASLMCGHCELFHESVFPEIEERYIEPGHVRFVFREFPTPPVNLAMAGFLLSSCAPEEQYFDMISVLFRQRMPLVEAAQSGEGAREAYLRIARSAGISDAQFDECLSDRDEQLRIADVVDRGADELGIEATPTFLINGDFYEGGRTIEQFAAVIDPILEDAGVTLEEPASDEDEAGDSAEDGDDEASDEESGDEEAGEDDAG